MAGKAAAKVYRTARWQAVRMEVLRAANWRCKVCRKYASEVHHRIPIHRGGAPYDKANLQAICRPCHYGAHVTEDRRTLRRELRELRAIAARLVAANESVVTCPVRTLNVGR